MGNDFTSWESVLKRKGYCKARVKLVEQTNQHTYTPIHANGEVAKVRAGINQCATETVMTNQQILGEQLARTSEGPAINLRPVEKLRRNIHSARQK